MQVIPAALASPTFPPLTRAAMLSPKAATTAIRLKIAPLGGLSISDIVLMRLIEDDS